MAETGANTYFLFTNQTTDGNSPPVAVNYSNKTAIVKVWGTFGTGTIKLQTLAPNSSPNVWIDVPDLDGSVLTFTSNTQSTLEFIVQNEQIRAVLASASGPTTLNVSLQIY